MRRCARSMWGWRGEAFPALCAKIGAHGHPASLCILSRAQKLRILFSFWVMEKPVFKLSPAERSNSWNLLIDASECKEEMSAYLSAAEKIGLLFAHLISVAVRFTLSVNG